MDDIQRDREKRQRDEMNKKISEDVANTLKGIKEKMNPPKKPSKIRRFIMFQIILGILLLLLNFILLNLWILKWVIKSLLGMP